MTVEALDSSVAVAALADWHPDHEVCRSAGSGAGIPVHALFETYSCLTRLPPGHRVDPVSAGAVLTRWFPAGAILEPPQGSGAAFFARLIETGIRGGATYDALVALTADAHDAQLMTLDRRAIPTYERLGIRFRLLAG